MFLHLNIHEDNVPRGMHNINLLMFILQNYSEGNSCYFLSISGLLVKIKIAIIRVLVLFFQ